MQQIPITFTHEGKEYIGTFDEISGAGSFKATVWYLMIDNYYSGRLRFTDKWVFDPTPKTESMAQLADLFGERVMLWYG